MLFSGLVEIVSLAIVSEWWFLMNRKNC